MSEPRLLLGDCLYLLPYLEAGSVDLILADLPYGTTACKWDSIIPLDKLWPEYRRVLKPRGAVVLTASQPFTSALVMSNPAWFRCEWIWKKNAGSNYGAVRYQPMKEHESILVFARRQPTYNPILQSRTASGRARSMYIIGAADHSTRVQVYGEFRRKHAVWRNPDQRCPSSVQAFTREMGLHPTQKPLALMEYLIRTYSNPDDLVLDNAFGSCTTGEAAINTGRRFVGMEQDPGYYQIGVDRLARVQATPQQPALLAI